MTSAVVDRRIRSIARDVFVLYSFVKAEERNPSIPPGLPRHQGLYWYPPTRRWRLRPEYGGTSRIDTDRNIKDKMKSISEDLNRLLSDPSVHDTPGGRSLRKFQGELEFLDYMQNISFGLVSYAEALDAIQTASKVSDNSDITSIRNKFWSLHEYAHEGDESVSSDASIYDVMEAHPDFKVDLIEHAAHIVNMREQLLDSYNQEDHSSFEYKVAHEATKDVILLQNLIDSKKASKRKLEDVLLDGKESVDRLLKYSPDSSYARNFGKLYDDLLKMTGLSEREPKKKRKPRKNWRPMEYESYRAPVAGKWGSNTIDSNEVKDLRRDSHAFFSSLGKLKGHRLIEDDPFVKKADILPGLMDDVIKEGSAAYLLKIFNERKKWLNKIQSSAKDGRYPDDELIDYLDNASQSADSIINQIYGINDNQYGMEGRPVSLATGEELQENSRLSQSLSDWNFNPFVHAEYEKRIAKDMRHAVMNLKPALQNNMMKVLEKHPPRMHGSEASWEAALDMWTERRPGKVTLGFYLHERLIKGIHVPSDCDNHTLTHEMAHQLDFNNISPEGSRLLKQRYEDLNRNGHSSVTNYAMSNMREYIAETISHFITNPRRLQELDPIAYDIVAEHIAQ